jgi:3-oxoacyl-[acyl-carrier-protein] synthase-3
VTAVLAGLGAWLSPDVVGNEHLSSTLDTSSPAIETRAGILERRVVRNGLETGDLAANAGARALASAGVAAVFVATTSPDRLCLAVAPEDACRLGMSDLPAFDPTTF